SLFRNDYIFSIIFSQIIFHNCRLEVNVQFKQEKEFNKSKFIYNFELKTNDNRLYKGIIEVKLSEDLNNGN
ncbi:MAG: hypothetical protein ACFFG0_07585, partial [Candidatus Thorarchaeota archaeon]